MKKINLSILVLIGFVFLLGGCSLKEIDEKLGDVINDFNDGKQSELLDSMNKEVKEDGALTFSDTKKAGDLGNEEKELINKWLEDEGYNRYGDDKDIMYTGGTPLFNETTGESIDRFDYILEKRPEILELLK